MKLRSQINVLALGLTILCMQVVTSAATIKTKDGKTVEGKIRGMIVQKGEVKLEKSEEGTIHGCMKYFFDPPPLLRGHR